MEGEELNQLDSSQPAPADLGDAGTNATGKPSEPVSSGMTDSQARDYYNKTQSLAAERREFEAERQKWVEQQRSQQAHYQQTPHQQTSYQPQQNFAGQNLNDGDVFKSLVDQFGVDGALAMQKAFNSFAAPVQQQIALSQQQIAQAQYSALKNEISSRGKSLFGNEWDANEKPVLEKITQYGCPLEEAWAIVNFGKQKQVAIDNAYKVQAQKTSGNVGSSSVSLTNVTPAAVNSIDDAINLAMREHAV
ncbi:MAG: hypothetical protein KBD78_03880 [Oligoflexales bacterium]|nr:hypothetical protein [Oligoflexales bacterium]